MWITCCGTSTFLCVSVCMNLCRDEQQRGSGAGGAWISNAQSAGLPGISAWVDAAVLAEGSWRETHLWVPAELPGGLLYCYWTPVPAWRKPVIDAYTLKCISSIYPSGKMQLPLLSITIPVINWFWSMALQSQAPNEHALVQFLILCFKLKKTFQDTALKQQDCVTFLSLK